MTWLGMTMTWTRSGKNMEQGGDHKEEEEEK